MKVENLYFKDDLVFDVIGPDSQGILYFNENVTSVLAYINSLNLLSDKFENAIRELYSKAGSNLISIQFDSKNAFFTICDCRINLCSIDNFIVGSLDDNFVCDDIDDTMTYEEYNNERREMGLDIDPQSDDSDPIYQHGYTNACTFDFILECDTEIFEDFQKWALILLDAETVAKSTIQQSFFEDLQLDSSCYFSDIEIFNIWFYKTNRVIYWICEDQDTFNNISEKHESFSDMLDAHVNAKFIVPYFVYGTVGIVVQVFYINSPFLGVVQSIEHYSIWALSTDSTENSCITYMNQGDDSVLAVDEVSNWDANNESLDISYEEYMAERRETGLGSDPQINEGSN